MYKRSTVLPNIENLHLTFSPSSKNSHFLENSEMRKEKKIENKNKNIQIPSPLVLE